MISLFKDIPEAIENTLEIALRCSYKVATAEPKLPRFSGLDLDGEALEFQEQAKNGLKERLESFKVNDAKKYCDLWDDGYGFFKDNNGNYHARGKDFKKCTVLLNSSS